jgi:hypothetical protein
MGTIKGGNNYDTSFNLIDNQADILRKASIEVMREGRRFLKATTRNPNEDVRRICESVGKHLPVTKDVTEVILRDLSERARKYFF